MRLGTNELGAFRQGAGDQHDHEVDQGDRRGRRHPETADDRAHRRRHQIKLPSAITDSGSRTTRIRKTPCICALVSRTQRGCRHARGDRDRLLVAQQPAHHRKGEIAVGHVGEKGVAGEVTVADHDRAGTGGAPACAGVPSMAAARTAPGGGPGEARPARRPARPGLTSRHGGDRRGLALGAARDERDRPDALGRRHQIQRTNAGEERERTFRVIGCGS